MGPEKSTLIAKSPEPPKKLCIKWENLLKTNLLRAICENCQVFFKMCVENESLKKDLELSKKNAEKLSKQKELKINSFTVNVKNPDKSKMSNFDLNFLKEYAEYPRKSYCELSDENKKLKKENDEIKANSEENKRKLKEIELFREKNNVSAEHLEENKKLKKEIEQVK